MDITNIELERLAMTLNEIGFRVRSMNLEPEGLKLPFRSYKTPDKTVRGGRISLVIDALPPHWMERKSEAGTRNFNHVVLPVQGDARSAPTSHSDITAYSYRPPPTSHVSHRNKQVKTKASGIGFKVHQYGLDRNKASLIRLGIFLESIGL